MGQSSSLIQGLKERGLRVTPQRAIIMQAMEGLTGHITAEEIFAEVQQVNRYISLATVYRTLDVLKELGLVTESHMGTTATHYALRTHANHHHAICRTCSGSIELPTDFFEATAQRLQEDFGFSADVDHVVIFGWCRECQRETTTAISSAAEGGATQEPA